MRRILNFCLGLLLKSQHAEPFRGCASLTGVSTVLIIREGWFCPSRAGIHSWGGVLLKESEHWGDDACRTTTDEQTRFLVKLFAGVMIWMPPWWCNPFSNWFMRSASLWMRTPKRKKDKEKLRAPRYLRLDCCLVCALILSSRQKKSYRIWIIKELLYLSVLNQQRWHLGRIYKLLSEWLQCVKHGPLRRN